MFKLRHRIQRALASLVIWNLPVAIAYIAYFLAYDKLLFIQATGLKIANWNAKTEIAVGMTCWLYENHWVFYVLLSILSLCAVLSSENKIKQRYSYVLLALVYAATAWFSMQEVYLNGKILCV